MPKKLPLYPPEGLLAKLEQELPPLPLAAELSIPGWTWECDLQGIYTACSPEVETILGISPVEFLGRRVAEFGLTGLSAQEVASLFHRGEFPAEANLQYLARSQKRVPVLLHISRTFSKEGEPKGWHGFTTTLPESEEPCNAVAGPQVPEMDEEKLALAAGQKVFEILENLRRNTPNIRKHPFSRITTKQVQETLEGLEGQTDGAEYTNGQKKVTGQKASVYEIQYKLEWGNKLDLTREERAFLERTQFPVTGVRGYLHRQFAPKKIVKSDSQWIAVFVILDTHGLSYVWVSHPQAITRVRSVKLDAFLAQPQVILPELEKAIEYPWITHVVLYAGEDYRK